MILEYADVSLADLKATSAKPVDLAIQTAPSVTNVLQATMDTLIVEKVISIHTNTISCHRKSIVALGTVSLGSSASQILSILFRQLRLPWR